MQSPPANTRLDVRACVDIEPTTLHMAQAIATATEALREELRKSPGWSTPQATGFGMRPLLGLPSWQLVDFIPWPILLLHSQCLSHAAELACRSSEQVLGFAISVCPHEHLASLLLLCTEKNAWQQTIKLLAPQLQKWNAQDRRVREGARRGGIKSAKTRSSQSKVLSPHKLRKEREQLIQQGRATREVAGILASKYGVHANTIRHKLKLTATADTV